MGKAKRSQEVAGFLAQHADKMSEHTDYREGIYRNGIGALKPRAAEA